MTIIVTEREGTTASWQSATVVRVLVALALLLLCQAKVPLQPVPITLQTLGLSLVALFWPWREAVGATLLYLGAASLGLPVLSGYESNALWLLKPAAGFLLAFPLYVAVVSYLRERCRVTTFLSTVGILLVGHLLLYAVGLSWLALYVAPEHLLAVGFIPFLPGLCLKVGAAACCHKAFASWVWR